VALRLISEILDSASRNFSMSLIFTSRVTVMGLCLQADLASSAQCIPETSETRDDPPWQSEHG
jgi:hypothetical protein